MAVANLKTWVQCFCPASYKKATACELPFEVPQGQNRELADHLATVWRLSGSRLTTNSDLSKSVQYLQVFLVRQAQIRDISMHTDEAAAGSDKTSKTIYATTGSANWSSAVIWRHQLLLYQRFRSIGVPRPWVCLSRQASAPTESSTTHANRRTRLHIVLP